MVLAAALLEHVTERGDFVRDVLHLLYPLVHQPVCPMLPSTEPPPKKTRGRSKKKKGKKKSQAMRTRPPDEREGEREMERTCSMY